VKQAEDENILVRQEIVDGVELEKVLPDDKEEGLIP